MSYQLEALKNNMVFRNGVLFAFFSFLNNGMNFLLLIILAKFLTPADYGELNLFNTLILLLSILITLNVESFFSISFFKESFKDVRRILNIIFLIAIFFFFFLSFCVSIFSNTFQAFIGLPFQYQWIALLICFFQVFNNINLEIKRLEEKPIKYGLFSLGIVTSNLALTFLFIILLHYGWQGRIYAQAVTTLFFFLISVKTLIKKKYLVGIKPNYQLFYKSLSFGTPLIPHSISGWIRMGVDRYIVNFFYGAAQVGFFSFAFNFSGIISMIGTAVNATHSVHIYKTLANGEASAAQKLFKQTKIIIGLYICITGVIYVLSSLFIPIFLPKYNESLLYLFPLCIAGMFQCIYYLFVNYIFYFNKTKGLMYITFSVSIIHFCLSLLLTRYSLLFTAYITMFTNALVCFSVFLYSNKIYKLKK